MKAGAALVALLAVSAPLASQEPASRWHWEAPRTVGTFADERARQAQLTGDAPLTSLMIRPLLRAATLDSASGDTTRRVQIALLNPTLRSTYNSRAPYGWNDGAMWSGRGLSLAADVGVEARWRWVTARVAPTIAWSQNQDFALGTLVGPPANASPYADVWNPAKIDRPQRFGDGAFTTVDPGQTMVRVDWRALAVGAGTENMWWGPGIDNSLLMSNTAAGIPHAFLGTGRPVDVKIGHVEATYVIGRMYDSDYWRTGDQPNRNRRWLGGLVATFTPRGAPGLYLGGGRVFYEYIPPGGLGLRDVLDVLQPFTKRHFSTPDNPTGEDSADQLLSLFARWVFPNEGFEVYGELGRNDHSWDFEDLVLEPDHGTASLLGFQKAFRRGERTLLVRGEITDLSLARTIEIRGGQSWYIHHIVRQGYTQRGQLMGAGIGPGSDSQRLQADWQAPAWSLGGWVERVRYDNDAFYQRYAPLKDGRRLHDVNLLLGIRARRENRWAVYSMSLGRLAQYNRYTTMSNDFSGMRVELRAELRP